MWGGGGGGGGTPCDMEGALGPALLMVPWPLAVCGAEEWALLVCGLPQMFLSRPEGRASRNQLGLTAAACATSLDAVFTAFTEDVFPETVQCWRAQVMHLWPVRSVEMTCDAGNAMRSDMFHLTGIACTRRLCQLSTPDASVCCADTSSCLSHCLHL